ncbi:MAG: kinase [Desulfovibrio sp.]|nr:kinase [Desulfovibrio sp.]MBI4959173.1 kinase [Desulfovibrio sp.]
MIITRTPFRISFFGGGSDYPAYYNDNGGAVLATTINRYCYISLRNLPPFFNYKYRIVYSKTELTKTIQDIVHPSARECLNYMDIAEGLEIHHDGDLPARTGLGSSSAFTVGLLHALHAHIGKMVSKHDLAETAIHIEQNVIKENVGSQDQTMTAFGGLNLIRFNCGDSHLQVTPMCLTGKRLEELQNHLLLFFTGFVRYASDIAAEQIRQTPSKRCELNMMAQMVDQAAEILCGQGDIIDFGKLLNESWLLKRSLTDLISTSDIDNIYSRALKAGAVGGKLLGAGGGGFILFMAPPERHQEIIDRLGILHVPFRFENAGSQVIFYEPDKKG